jgi:D-aminopeptidase
MSNSSGDYVIAFSTAKERIESGELLPNSEMSLLFRAVVEATEEAVYNSLFKATCVVGWDNHSCEALPIKKTIKICRKYNVLQ